MAEIEKIKQEITEQQIFEKETFKSSLDEEGTEKTYHSPIELAPSLPLNSITGLAREFSELYYEWESAPEFFFFSFLTMLGASCLKVNITDVAETYDPPRLYVLLLGDTGTSKKSTAIQETRRFFKELYIDIPIVFCDGVGSAEGLQRKILEKDSSGKALIMVYDEFSSFVSKCQIQSSTLLPMVNTLFERTSYENVTKDRDNRVDDAHLVLLAASTVETYHRTWVDVFTNIGFDNRLFLVPGRPTMISPYPKAISLEKKQILYKRTSKIIKKVESGIVLSWEGRAQAMFGRWYASSKSSPTRYGVRLDSYARRLLKIISLNNERDVIDETTTSQVIAIVDWQLGVRNTLVPPDVENKWARMEQNIVKALGRSESGSMTQSNLSRVCHAKVYGIKIFQDSLHNLEKIGDIRTSVGKRKDSKIWRLVS